jgi:hypothetical protein
VIWVLKQNGRQLAILEPNSTNIELGVAFRYPGWSYTTRFFSHIFSHMGVSFSHIDPGVLLLRNISTFGHFEYF